MNYLPLSEHKNSWIFNHKELQISDADKALIKPMTPQRARMLWNERISKQSLHPDLFSKGDWLFDINTWHEQGEWESLWEGDELALPALILDTLQWDLNTVVYYCCSQEEIIETNWAVFQRCWKNFLFMDNGALLIGKKRDDVVQFLSNGSFQLGKKPA